MYVYTVRQTYICMYELHFMPMMSFHSDLKDLQKNVEQNM